MNGYPEPHLTTSTKDSNKAQTIEFLSLFFPKNTLCQSVMAIQFFYSGFFKVACK